MANSEALATREMGDGIEKKVGRRGPLSSAKIILGARCALSV